MNVLIIGNILKDIYLRLDERLNKFETDENGTPWLDLAFDGSTYNFFRRTSIYGGAAVSLEVLNRFGHDAHIAGARLGFVSGEVVPNGQVAAGYRYMLCHGNKISYLVQNTREETVWVNPTMAVDWIFIDRSAGITEELIKELKNFLSMSSHTRVAVYTPRNSTELDKRLLKMADMIFTDDELDFKDDKVATCKISDREITLGEARQTWRIERTDLMTHLTTHSIIAASVFSALLNGKSVHEALLLAKVNAENASLSGTLPLDRLEELAQNQDEDKIDIQMIAAQLMAPGKGILAADESGGSIHKKFESMNIPDDEIHRRDYRNIFFSTPEIERYLNGVILFDETTRQESDDGRNFVDFLTAHGIIPGIKVDKGLTGTLESGEKYTEGLEDLPVRLEKYYQDGLRFAKWRAAFEITYNTPSEEAIIKNAEILAKYAKMCQEANIVPIVEPEVVYDGNYTLEQCADITGKVLDTVFEELGKANVRLEACILKTNMILAGKQYPIQSTAEEVGRATATVLRGHVPPTLAGVVFLSGGQSVEQATANLAEIIKNGPFPWPVTFSFARALQDTALGTWMGNNENADKARAAFKERLIKNTEVL
ncbi:fructose-bisphosphate aldolase class I [Candidatus Saccharibacteria bacterium]|nr:fructose-bisphosphate aldolase class I [Candidatus Saccharibacteria bacterium]